MRPSRLLVAVAALVATALSAHVPAANLVIGLSADVTAIDPHYHNLTPNNNVAQHLFDYLVLRNEKSQAIPGLATDWKAIEPTVWEFKLRRGVRFSDGSEFTAADVVASIERVPKVPNSPSPFTAAVRRSRLFRSLSRSTRHSASCACCLVAASSLRRAKSPSE